MKIYQFTLVFSPMKLPISITLGYSPWTSVYLRFSDFFFGLIVEAVIEDVLSLFVFPSAFLIIYFLDWEGSKGFYIVFD